MFLDTLSHADSGRRRFCTRLRLPRPLLTAAWLALAGGAYLLGPGLPCAAILLIVAILAAMDLAIWLPQPSGMSFRMAEQNARRIAQRCGEPPERAALWGEAARLRMMSDPALQARAEEHGLLLSAGWIAGTLMVITFPTLLGKDPAGLAYLASVAGFDLFRRLPVPRSPAQPRAEMLARLEVLEQQGIPTGDHLARAAAPSWVVLLVSLPVFLALLIFFPGLKGMSPFVIGAMAWGSACALIDELLPRPFRLRRWLAARRTRKASLPPTTQHETVDEPGATASHWTDGKLTAAWTLLVLISAALLRGNPSWAYGILLTAMALAALDLYNRLPGRNQTSSASPPADMS